MLTYQLLADAVLLLHFAVVLYVIGGLVAIYAGNVCNWKWVNNIWFRIAHVLAIGFVVVQSWLGEVCPLTILESWLRHRAGQASYNSSFIEDWVQRILFYQAPSWVFTITYTVFGSLVLIAWWYFPPVKGKRHGHANSA